MHEYMLEEAERFWSRLGVHAAVGSVWQRTEVASTSDLAGLYTDVEQVKEHISSIWSDVGISFPAAQRKAILAQAVQAWLEARQWVCLVDQAIVSSN